MEALNWLQSNWMEVVAAVGAAVMLARIAVLLTPNKKDDAFLAKIVDFLKVIGLHVKDKEGK